MSVGSVHDIQCLSRISLSHWVLRCIDLVLLILAADIESRLSSQNFGRVEIVDSNVACVSSLVISDVALAYAVDHFGTSNPRMSIDARNGQNEAQRYSDSRHDRK